MQAQLKELDGRTFDFVIVGGGTAGCLIAARLATALPSLSVLLIEAGGEVEEEDLIPGFTKPRFGSVEGNWQYQTTPQAGLNGRIIPYPRGRGMGGCSGNNFMAWVRGPKADYDDWAERVGDDWWKWDNVLPKMKELEDFREEIPEGKECYAKASPGVHGTGGPFTVGYGPAWQDLVEYCMLASQEAGHSVNLDNNDGDLEGISIAQFNVGDGARITSSTAFLGDKSALNLKNLRIVTRSLASRLILEKSEVKGIEIIPTKPNGSETPITVMAKKEVILTAGCFQSPQLLLLSGIGPSQHLKEVGIPVAHDLPAVGRNLQDHSAFACEFIVKPSIAGHNQLLNNPKELKDAVTQYKATKDGPLSMFGASAAILFPRLQKLFDSEEFSKLPEAASSFMKANGRPSTEIWMHSGPLFYTGPCPPDASVLVVEGLCQNNLSRGSLELASKDPRTLPKINPGYLSHPYDIAIARETIREIVRLAQTPTFSSIIESILLGPRSPVNSEQLCSISGADDKIIEDFVRDTLTQGFHSMSTCVMGKSEDPNKVVGTDFKVVGLKGLRIADMSICPMLTSNHTQVNAYLIGERCVGLVIEEHSRRVRIASSKL